MAVQREAELVEIPPERLNPTDATLWDIERNPSLRTTIVAVLVLDRPVEAAALVDGFEAASRQVPRLRQCVVEQPGGVGVPRWVIDDDFDVRDHLRFVDPLEPVDEAVIAATAEPIASTPFDRTRPLWECTYLGGADGPAALVLKVHHSLTDGVGGMEVLDAILDRQRDAPPRDLERMPIPRAGRTAAPLSGAGDALVRRAVEVPFDVAEAATTATFHPRRTAQGVWEGARSATRLLAPSPAPLSPLMVGRSGDRRAGMTELDLNRLRAAARRHGCTLNHAFFAGVLGGIADYHRELGTPVDRLRVTMPVSIRRADDPAAGNRWAPVRFVVPMDIADPVERMHAMAALVRTHRAERALSFSQRLAGLVQMLPSTLSSGVVAGMMHGVDATLTNVPGLTEPHYLAGAAVERVYAFAPTAGTALNVGLVSHLDAACVGTLSDAAAVSDPPLLQRLITAGLEDLVAAAEAAAPSSPPEPIGDASATPSSEPVGDAPTTPSSERLSALDTGFLRIETPETPMHLGAVFVLDGSPLRDDDGALRIDDIRRHVDARIRRVPRFTRRLAEVPLGLGRPLWVDDEHFDIARHVAVTSVGPPGDEQALLDLAAELFGGMLDRSHPLWEIWLVDGLPDGRVGLVEKIHHALVDGIGGVDVAAILFDTEPNPHVDRPVRTPPVPGPDAAARLLGAVADQLTDPVRTASSAMSSLARSPDRIATGIGRAATALGALVRPGSRAPSVSHNRDVGPGRAFRAVTFDLDEVRRIGEPVGATVNDVVLAVVTGAVRSWYRDHGEELVDVHVLVPVSVRHHPFSEEPGNHVGGVVVTLPIGEADPARRLDIVHRRMERLKASHEGEGAAVVLGALDHVPGTDRALARLVSVQPFVNLVVTNVPGSPIPLHLLGARIESISPIVPLGPNLGLGIAILTYAGRLTISVSVDPALCPDVGALPRALSAELATLADQVARR